MGAEDMGPVHDSEAILQSAGKVEPENAGPSRRYRCTAERIPRAIAAIAREGHGFRRRERRTGRDAPVSYTPYCDFRPAPDHLTSPRAKAKFAGQVFRSFQHIGSRASLLRYDGKRVQIPRCRATVSEDMVTSTGNSLGKPGRTPPEAGSFEPLLAKPGDRREPLPQPFRV